MEVEKRALAAHTNAHAPPTYIVQHVMRTTNYCSCHGLFICRWSFYSRGIRPNHERRKLLICVRTHVHTYTLTHTRVYIHTYVHTYTRTRLQPTEPIRRRLCGRDGSRDNGIGGRRDTRQTERVPKGWAAWQDLPEYNSHIVRHFSAARLRSGGGGRTAANATKLLYKERYTRGRFSIRNQGLVTGGGVHGVRPPLPEIVYLFIN